MRSASKRVSLLFLLFGCIQAWAQVTLPFTDNFSGPTLDPAWQVLPGQGSYTVGGGVLRYYNDGPVASSTGWYNTALTLALPFTGRNWKMEIQAKYNLFYVFPGGNATGGQGPEVLVKFSPDFAPGGYGTPSYAGYDFAVIERDIDACTGCNPANYLFAGYGAVGNSNLLNPADAGTPPPNNIGGGTYWYQIIRQAGMLTLNVSYDGTNYFQAFSAPLSNPSSTFNELLIGGITFLTAGSYTDYGPVTITSLETPATTQTTLSSSANPSLLGQNVTLTAAVTAVPPSAGTPAGNVQFLIDGAPSGSPVTLSGGMASISTAALSLGSHTITAQYGGDATFPGSSGVLNQQVNYGFSGLQSPYAPPAQRTFKAGSAVPLIWQYTDYSGSVLDSSSATPVVNIVSIPCGGTGGTAIDVNDAGSSGYQYSTSTDTWQFNWKTTGLAPGCFNISITNTQTGQTNGFFAIQLR